MGLPIVTLSRLVDRKHLPVVHARGAWRFVATALLIAVVLPVMLTAAAFTLPVLLTVGLAVGVRQMWQWRAARHRGTGEPD